MRLTSRLPAHLAGVFFLAGLVLPGAVTAQDELLSAPPEERSTPESIQFAPVDEEQLGQTSIQGALGPSAAGVISEDVDTQVEPVYLSNELRRALDLDEQELQSQRDQLLGPTRGVPAQPTEVQFPAYENRSYSPSSETNSTFR